MTTLLKNKFAVLILFIVLGCLLLVSLLIPKDKHIENYLSAEKVEELRHEYPIYNKDPDFLSTRPLAFEEIMGGVDSIVIGYIDEMLPSYQISLPLVGESDKAIYEKNKALGFDQKDEFIQRKLKVEKLVAGAPVNDEVILSLNAMFKDIEPQFKTGMKILIALEKGNYMHEGKHFFSRYGTYYIVEENYVLPAYEKVDYDSKKLTGASLDQLITTIQSVRED